MAGKSPRILDRNLQIQGDSVDQKKPLDYRYGPWKSLSHAKNNLYMPEYDIDYVYYGLTIGINVYAEPGVYSSEITGVDEYWWQPKCVLNDNYDPSDPLSQMYVDGFIRKFPSNSPGLVQESYNKIVLGIEPGSASSGSTEYRWNTSAAWALDRSGTDWTDLTQQSEIDDVSTEEP